jgi:hypothetical protein
VVFAGFFGVDGVCGVRWWGRFLFGGDFLRLLVLDKPALTALVFLSLWGRFSEGEASPTDWCCGSGATRRS